LATIPFQMLSASSLTHASTVPVEPRSSDGASATVTNDVEPLNSSPWPYLPAVHAAAVIAPPLPLPEASAVVAPTPSLNGY
jgi:hypothetical protein